MISSYVLVFHPKYFLTKEGSLRMLGSSMLQTCIQNLGAASYKLETNGLTELINHGTIKIKKIP